MRSKVITIRMPIDILEQLTKVREEDGVSVTFQLAKGAELYLKKRKSFFGAK
ncbi:hypothetical protein GOV13_02715 [Candidatus Pacearchaeota archaeon]|nr:hypothetical protein [Candidatus Pacearchaeota archaeon]